MLGRSLNLKEASFWEEEDFEYSSSGIFMKTDTLNYEQDKVKLIPQILKENEQTSP
jgi:hypothetical protein